MREFLTLPRTQLLIKRLTVTEYYELGLLARVQINTCNILLQGFTSLFLEIHINSLKPYLKSHIMMILIIMKIHIQMDFKKNNSYEIITGIYKIY